MKIAISAVEGSLDSQVDPRFGRAAWFLLIETETGDLYEAVNNSAGKEAAHGAGIAAAALVADKGVQAVLTGRVGPKALPILQKADVQIINDISGSIRDVLANFSGFEKPEISSEDTPVGDMPRKCNGTGPGRGMGNGQGRGKGQGRGQCRR